LKINQRFSGIFLLNFTVVCFLLQAGFLLGLFFITEGEAEMFLRNLG
jgi:hypothetical protein